MIPQTRSAVYVSRYREGVAPRVAAPYAAFKQSSDHLSAGGEKLVPRRP